MDVLDVDQNFEVVFAIKGLVSEGDRVRDRLYEYLPGMILIGISPEELEGLKKFMEEPFTVPMGDYEVIYGTILSKFGEVEIPPPIFTQAVTYGVNRNIPMKGIDLDEDTFGDFYGENFRIRDLVRYIRKKRRMMRREFNLNSPEEFVVDWKNEIETNPGLKKMEESRSAQICTAISNARKEMPDERIMAVIEYEMKDDVERSLRGQPVS
ncbi:MAG: hypothetical protein M1496_06435 [Candidatus Thermoplasmatota archaeon]|jgi:hypothetical protein|nr:hypothetical protein [Candidatus Thermoplasmatota archaeon]